MWRMQHEPQAMTGEELALCLTTIGWSARRLALLLHIDESQVRRWLYGRYTIPTHIARWLRQLAACHKAHPPPPYRLS
jgi:hypothetical protein